MTTIELEPKDNIGEALRKAPAGPVTIILSEGTWREKVVITRPDVTIISEQGSVIQADDHKGMLLDDGRSATLANSATFTVAASNFTAMGVTFSNTYDYESAKKWNEEHKDEPKHPLESVAFLTTFGCGKVTLRACNFLGHKGTLFLDYGDSFLEDCTIRGVDSFILGAGSALFQGCEIVSEDKGVICFPSTYAVDEIGFIFHDCAFTTEGEVKPGSVLLAAPWFPAAVVDRKPMVLAVDCEMKSHVNAYLWTEGKTTSPDGKVKSFSAANARFFIYSDRQENIKGEFADALIRQMMARV